MIDVQSASRNNARCHIQGARKIWGLMRGLRLLGHCDDVKEEIYAIRSRPDLHHPLVMQVVAARDQARSGSTGVIAVRTKT